MQIAEWKQYPWLRHGFSTRSGGVSEVYGGKSLNLGWTKDDDPAHVAENRRLLMRAVAGTAPSEQAPPAITLRQIHSTRTHIVTADTGPYTTPDNRALVEGDGLMTALPNTLLAIQTADCVPVMVIDPAKRVVSVFHAGWRGTAAAIVEIGVATMSKEFGSRPADLIAAVGPSIGPCCYTVGQELHTAFAERFPYAAQLFDRDRLNLWEANRRQLLDSGVPSNRIVVVGECTGCTLEPSGERKYFSHRIEHGFTGRMMSVVGIAPTN
ncbi:MAG: peptidoglycan editing factor PgeF [Granulicella sp.]